MFLMEPNSKTHMEEQKAKRRDDFKEEQGEGRTYLTRQQDTIKKYKHNKENVKLE